MGCQYSKRPLEDYYTVEEPDGRVNFNTFVPRDNVCSYSYSDLKEYYFGVTPQAFAERISQAGIAYVAIQDGNWNIHESTEHLINAMILNGWTLSKSNYYSVSFIRTAEQVHVRLERDSTSHKEFE